MTEVCRYCNGTGIEGINRGEGLMPRCDACEGSGEAPMGDPDEYGEEDLSHEFAMRLSEYGIAMAHRQSEKARVLAEVLQSMFEATQPPQDERGQRRIIRSQSCRVCEGIGQWHDNEGDNDDYCNACNGTGREPDQPVALTGRAAIVDAWNNLPPEIRQSPRSPELDALYAAISACDDASQPAALPTLTDEQAFKGWLLRDHGDVYNEADADRLWRFNHVSALAWRASAILAASAPAQPVAAEVAGRVEKAAHALWERFAPDHSCIWDDEPHKAEYRAAASEIISILAGTGSDKSRENGND